MEKIDFLKQNIPFTQVANGVLYDKSLSLGAKTVYAFMYSKPDGWQFSAQRIGDELGVTEPTILKHLNELKLNGYLLSQKQPDGRMLYKVVFPPIESVEPNTKDFGLGVEPNTKKARLKKSQTEKSWVISNKDKYKVIKKEESNKDNTLATKSLDEVNQLLSYFRQNINPHLAFNNKTQRKASEELLKAYGLEKIQQALAYLEERRRTDAYLPTVTTPYELLVKWAKIKQYLESKKIEQLNERNPSYVF